MSFSLHYVADFVLNSTTLIVLAILAGCYIFWLIALILIKRGAHLDYEDNLTWLRRAALGLLGFVLMVGFFKPGNIGGDVDPQIKTEQDNLRKVAQAYVTCLELKTPPHLLTVQEGDTVHAIALILAQHTGLTHGDVYFAPVDPKAPAVRPEVAQPRQEVALVVAQPHRDIVWILTPDFARATLSLEMAANIPVDAPLDTTPVVWSRGLQPDGTWAADSPWSGKGGCIAFLDGHVLWVEGKLSTGWRGTFLTKYGTKEPTVNIKEALPPGAVVLRAEPRAMGK